MGRHENLCGELDRLLHESWLHLESVMDDFQHFQEKLFVVGDVDTKNAQDFLKVLQEGLTDLSCLSHTLWTPVEEVVSHLALKLVLSLAEAILENFSSRTDRLVKIGDAPVCGLKNGV